MKNSSFWRIATALFAVGSIIYTTTSSSRSRRQNREQVQDESAPEYDVPVEYQRVFDKNLIIPAGWSFGVVWSMVYSGLGALLVHQALPSQLNNPRYQQACLGGGPVGRSMPSSAGFSRRTTPAVLLYPI